MRKLLSTDIDGTLLFNATISPTDLAAVTRWRDAGNLLVPNTGRSVAALRSALRGYDLAFDYSVLYTGAALIGPDYGVLEARTLPDSFAEEILEILTYLGDEPVPEQVPGSLLLGAPGVPDDAVQASEPDGPRVRAIPGEGTHPNVWVLGSSVNGARVAGRLGLPFAVASHFAPVQAEAAIATYRSVLESRTDDAPGPQGAPDVPRVAAAVNVMVAPSQEEARLLFSTAMAAAARIVGNRPGPLDPPSEDPQAWRAYAPGREDAVEAAMSLSFVGTADDVAARLREQAARWDLDEVLVVTYAHDPALRRRSYELLAQAWNA